MKSKKKIKGSDEKNILSTVDTGRTKHKLPVHKFKGVKTDIETETTTYAKSKNRRMSDSSEVTLNKRIRQTRTCSKSYETQKISSTEKRKVIPDDHNFSSKKSKKSYKDSIKIKDNSDTISFEEIEKKIFDIKETVPKIIKTESESHLLKTAKKIKVTSTQKSSIPDKVVHKHIKNTNCTTRGTTSRDLSNSIKNKTKPESQKKLKIKSSIAHESNKVKHIPDKPKGKTIPVKADSESNSDVSDWEEVDELSEILSSNKKEKFPGNDVQIEIEASNLLWGARKRKRRSEQEIIEDYLRKEVNKSIKVFYENKHKVHLLCLLAHGMYLNSIMAKEDLLASALSIIPKGYFSPKRLDMDHLEKFLTWFRKHISITPKTDELGKNATIDKTLLKRFETKSACSNKELVIMFVITSRAIGMTVRFVQSLVPMTWKPSADSLIKPKKEEEEKIVPTNVPSSVPVEKKKGRKMLSTDSDQECSKPQVKKKKIKIAKSRSTVENVELDDSDQEYRPQVKKRKIKLTKSRSTGENEELNDFVKPRLNLKGKGNINSRYEKKNKKQSLEDTKDLNKRLKNSILTEWAEVYVEEEEKWISVDVMQNKIHCASEIEARCQNPSYVVAFNPDQTIKDVTRRYVSNWLSHKNKIQCDGEWWTKSVKPFLGRRDRRDKEEDKELEENLLRKPLPKTISEFKNHPLYALQRHLLKFEAIYPPDESPVGFIRGEPVFPRSSVKTLFGRENWLKEAKTVIVDEEPYKIVKARPKWNKGTGEIIKDRPLELFGEWQVEDYEPPLAKNGKVPRNEYGNVDLFKPSMLPRGCVHLQNNGLGQIARKLRIDCVPAVVGFDFRSWGSHPVYDGFVVCEEFKEVLIDAWRQEQLEQAKREEEKRLKRIYGNWKKLIHGRILKDRLKEKYGVVTERNVREKESKRKIKQEDLDAIPSSTITHAVPNIKIDLTSSITDTIRKKTKRKPRELKKLNKDDAEPSNAQLDSDSEDNLSLKEKQEKIRNILRWTPTSRGGQGDDDPALSDVSECGESSGKSNRKQHSLDLNTHSIKDKKSSKSDKGKSRKGTGKIVGKKARKPELQSAVSPNPNLDSEEEEIPRRRSFRTRNHSDVRYKNSDESDSDISLCESDVSDKVYKPFNETCKESVMDLSEEST